MKDEPERGFAFLTGYNGKDKCQTDKIEFITPFMSGKVMIIELSISTINLTEMTHIEIITILLMASVKQAQHDVKLMFGIWPTYWLYQ